MSAMDSFTPERWRTIECALDARRTRVADVVLELLGSLEGVVEGFPVDQLTHGCQAAARAERAGASAEVVVAALCHDVGKAVSWSNHAAISAEILRPFLSDDVYHVVRWHQDFQARHYATHAGGDPDARDRHRGEPWFELAERFCDDWDQCSFDPMFDTPPLDHFEPVLREVLGSGG